MPNWAAVGLLAISTAIAGCADIQTVGRRTQLPIANSTESGGIAIHLDAQQRLAIVNATRQFCAEPSPDALAAYASSLGLGASAPSEGAASVASALQSSAGSIGLRTQSITLMRDSLYRICEAYANGKIGPAQVMTLLARSQDLTAGVLAIEQLTGAVAANQVILTSTANAGASASLLSDQKLLDAAKEHEKEKEKELEDARLELSTLEAQIKTKTEEQATARKNVDEAPTKDPPLTSEQIEELNTILATKTQELQALQAKKPLAEQKVSLKQEQLADATEVREAIENSRDAALTSAQAGTSSSGQFSVVMPRKQLSDDATKEIASAVRKIVAAIVYKDYTVESCVALVTNPPPGLTGEYLKSYITVRDKCLELFVSRAALASKQAEDSTKALVGP